MKKNAFLAMTELNPYSYLDLIDGILMLISKTLKSKGMNVAFVSSAFTRYLYKGVLAITPVRVTDLPDEDNGVESVLTGGGVDASLMVAAVEGSWQEDVKMLEQQEYHQGVADLTGAVHVGKSRTAWSNVDENTAKRVLKKTGRSVPYHVRSTWGKGGQAIWGEDEEPFYLYVQDPATVRLVFTVNDDDVVGPGSVVGSTHRKLADLIPQARLSLPALMELLKSKLKQKIERGEYSVEELIKNSNNITTPVGQVGWDVLQWEGELKLNSKPRLDNKNGQVMMGVAAGAALAGPVGAALGGLVGTMYEGEVRGRIRAKIRYLPIPPADSNLPRKKYQVLGGLPGVNWGEMYQRYLLRHFPDNVAIDESQREEAEAAWIASRHLAGNDLEHCFFINHDGTGCSCALYRSLENKLIVISFRGTCAPKDLITDASIVQDAWVEGEDVKLPEVAKVHSGFRNSLSSISRRLKELLLAAVAPGDALSDYDIIVTGHSLGGALATLFTADIAEFGIEAGRALPQVKESDPWWKSVASSFIGQTTTEVRSKQGPPRPKSLRVYNFGSPRVGNEAFSDRFESLVKSGLIQQAYRIVNGEDLVARHPRTMNALVFGSISYDHCGATVLVSPNDVAENVESKQDDPFVMPRVWVEGESDGKQCPVRDGTPLASPLADGSLLAELYNVTLETWNADAEQEAKVVKGAMEIAAGSEEIAKSAGKDAEQSSTSISLEENLARFSRLASQVTQRLSTITATDLASVVGIDRQFTLREMRMISSILNGQALAHHMEDQYYAAMGRAVGMIARVGEELREEAENI
jgi:hypothetical protein